MIKFPPKAFTEKNSTGEAKAQSHCKTEKLASLRCHANTDVIPIQDPPPPSMCPGSGQQLFATSPSSGRTLQTALSGSGVQYRVVPSPLKRIPTPQRHQSCLHGSPAFFVHPWGSHASRCAVEGREGEKRRGRGVLEGPLKTGTPEGAPGAAWPYPHCSREDGARKEEDLPEDER